MAQTATQTSTRILIRRVAAIAICILLCAFSVTVAAQRGYYVHTGQNSAGPYTGPTRLASTNCFTGGFDCLLNGMNVIAGDSLWVACTGTTGTLSVSDNNSPPDTFVIANPSHNAGSMSTTAESWYVQSITANMTGVSIDCHDTNNVNFIAGNAIQFTGVASPTLDQVGEADIASAGPGSVNGGVTPTISQANELVLSSWQSSDFGAGTGWAVGTAGGVSCIDGGGSSVRQVEYCYVVNISAITPTATFTSVTNTVAMTATFK